ncbi:MAG: TVP38/TMEM64 family protein [Rhodospirillales bacterium]
MDERDQEKQPDTQHMKATPSVISRIWPLALVAAAMAAVFVFDLDRFLSFQALKENREFLLEWTAENRALAAIGFISGYCIMVALSVPGAVWATLAGGFVFGTVIGGAYVVTGATLGATAIFLIARYALVDMLRAKTGNAISKMKTGFNENALSYMFVLRLVPLFPFWLVNLVPAFLDVPLRTYVIGTFFGIIPGSIVYVSVGAGLGSVFEQGGKPDLGIIFTPEILLPILGLAALSLVPVLYKRFKSGRGQKV